jgi:hypothetical protein
MAGPTLQALDPCLGVESSGVLWNLPMYTPQNYPVISFDVLDLFGGFLFKSCRKYKFTKTHGNYQ